MPVLKYWNGEDFVELPGVLGPQGNRGPQGTPGGYISDAPVGLIAEWPGVTPPNKWGWCDGSIYNPDQYPDLFAVVGFRYNTASGLAAPPTGMFRVPDYRGRVSIGSGQGSGLTSHAQGDTGGSESVTLTAAQMPTHNHSWAGSVTANQGGHTHAVSVSINNAATAHSHSINHGHTMTHSHTNNHDHPAIVTGNPNQSTSHNHGGTGGGSANHTHSVGNANANHTHSISSNSHAHTVGFVASAKNPSTGAFLPYNTVVPYSQPTRINTGATAHSHTAGQAGAGHSHGVGASGASHTHGIPAQALSHNHNVNIPNYGGSTGGSSSPNTGNFTGTSGAMSANSTHNHAGSASIAAGTGTHSHAISSVTVGNAGSGSAHPNMQPWIAMPKIIRLIP